MQRHPLAKGSDIHACPTFGAFVWAIPAVTKAFWDFNHATVFFFVVGWLFFSLGQHLLNSKTPSFGARTVPQAQFPKQGSEGERRVVECSRWTAGKARGGVGHLGLTHTGTQRGRLWTTGGRRRCVGSKNRQTTPATTSTTPVRQLLGTADARTASAATSTAPTHQLLGSANAETTPAGAPAAAANTTQRPDATCEGKNG